MLKRKRNINNLNPNIFKDNKNVWKAISPFISDKQNIFQKDYILLDNENVTSDATDVAEKMNNCCTDVIENLDIEHFEEQTTEINPPYSIETIVRMYSKHPSILKIKGYVTIGETCSFRNITNHELENEIKKRPTLFQEILPTHKNSYNLRNNRCRQTINVRTEVFGTELCYLEAKKPGNFFLTK